jgi:hypothetical protein
LNHRCYWPIWMVVYTELSTWILRFDIEKQPNTIMSYLRIPLDSSDGVWIISPKYTIWMVVYIELFPWILHFDLETHQITLTISRLRKWSDPTF